MKLKTFPLLTLASLNSIQAAVIYQADIAISPIADPMTIEESGPVELTATIVVSEVPTSFSTFSGADTGFRVESVTFQGDINQTISNLSNPLVNFAVAGEASDFVVDLTIPLPDGIIDANEPLFFNSLFFVTFPSSSPSSLANLDASDFDLLLDPTGVFGNDILEGGPTIIAESELPAFFDGTLDFPAFNDASSSFPLGNFTIVPEPSSVLLGVVAMGFSMRRRRRIC